MVPSQARLSLPQCLEIKIVTRTVQSSLFTLNDSREGIWVRLGEETIPAGTLFGPLKGQMKRVSVADSTQMRKCLENRHFWNLGMTTTAAAAEEEASFPSEVSAATSNVPLPAVTFLDVSDEQKSNWMRFVKKWAGSPTDEAAGSPAGAGAEEESNLTAILHERKIYFVASQPLRPGEELCFWYAKDYLSMLDVQDFSSKVESLNVSDVVVAGGEGNGEASMAASISFGSVAASVPEKNNAGKKNSGKTARSRKNHVAAAAAAATPAVAPVQLACYVCKKSNFETRSLLIGHVNENHPEEASAYAQGDEALTCHVCLKSFSDVSALNKHKRYHMVAKKYKCHACNVGFKQKSHLANHLISHTKDKRFVCKLCSTLFGRISDLRSHVKTAHDNEGKTFACSHCSKKFTTVKILNKHVSKHLYRFRCSRCQKCFASNYHLKRHEMFSSCLNQVIGKVNGRVVEETLLENK